MLLLGWAAAGLAEASAAADADISGAPRAQLGGGRPGRWADAAGVHARSGGARSFPPIAGPQPPDPACAQLVAASVKLPGIVAKWGSAGGARGPLQDWGAPGEWSWALPDAADTAAAAVLACAVLRPATAPRPPPRALARGCVAGLAVVGVVCAGRSLFALPWLVAVALHATSGGSGGALGVAGKAE